MHALSFSWCFWAEFQKSCTHGTAGLVNTTRHQRTAANGNPALPGPARGTELMRTASHPASAHSLLPCPSLLQGEQCASGQTHQAREKAHVRWGGGVCWRKDGPFWLWRSQGCNVSPVSYRGSQSAAQHNLAQKCQIPGITVLSTTWKCSERCCPGNTHKLNLP